MYFALGAKEMQRHRSTPPQSKIGVARAALSTMPARPPRWEAARSLRGSLHGGECPGAISSCAQVCILLIGPGTAKQV